MEMDVLAGNASAVDGDLKGHAATLAVESIAPPWRGKARVVRLDRIFGHGFG